MTADYATPHVALIVEGPGDHGAAPRLVRSYLHSRNEFRDILGDPLSAKGLGNLTVAGGIEKFVNIATARPGCVAVVVIVDSDQQCPVEVGVALKTRIEWSRVPVEVCVADRDFEDWLYASVESFGIEGSPVYHESHRGATELGSLLHGGYKKTVDQPRLASKVDPNLARGRSASLDRLFRKIDSAIELIEEGNS